MDHERHGDDICAWLLPLVEIHLIKRGTQIRKSVNVLVSLGRVLPHSAHCPSPQRILAGVGGTTGTLIAPSPALPRRKMIALVAGYRVELRRVLSPPLPLLVPAK